MTLNLCQLIEFLRNIFMEKSSRNQEPKASPRFFLFLRFTPFYVLYFSIQVRLLSHTLVLKFITLTSSARLPSHYFYCINICNVF